VERALTDGARTPDIAAKGTPVVSTQEAGEAVVKRLAAAG